MKIPKGISIGFILISIFWIVTGLAFDRFWLYNSQNRYLDPTVYKAEVITAADFDLLSDSTLTTVTLSDGRKMTKMGNVPYHVIPYYKSIDDGNRYVSIRINGTAAFFPRILERQIPILMMLIIGLMLEVVRAKKELKGSAVA